MTMNPSIFVNVICLLNLTFFSKRSIYQDIFIEINTIFWHINTKYVEGKSTSF